MGSVHSMCLPRGGGVLGYFLGGYVPSGTPNWHPVLKRFLLKLIPRSRNGPVFLYPLLTFALKLMPRSRNGPIFYTPFWGATRVKQFAWHWTVFLKAICPWIKKVKWLLTKLELSHVRNIIPRSRKRLWNGYPVLNKERQNHDPVGRHIPV